MVTATASPRAARERPQPPPDARQPDWPFRPTRLGTRQLSGERACQGARPARPSVQDPRVVDYCAAQWLVFPPPLTSVLTFCVAKGSAGSACLFLLRNFGAGFGLGSAVISPPCEGQARSAPS